MKPRIVLSGVNFVEGGPLAVFQDALRSLSESFLDRFDVTALVHRRDLFNIPGVDLIEFPDVKGSWLRRLYFEYVECRALSRELAPFLWLAMHDITPNVSAHVRAVYCHNPAPFYRLPLREALLDRSFALFRLLYRFLYAINISKNDFVIVQQNWLRQEFQRMFPVRNVVVAHPSVPPLALETATSRTEAQSRNCVFFYPALSRCFKNFELLLQAVKLLEEREISDFEVRLTVNGTENPYAASLRKRFGELTSIRWLGLQTRACVEDLYQEADCLVFPSKLETWGMPISEWKRTGKPMLVADLPYAHETVEEYANVNFIDPYNAEALAKSMTGIIRGEAHFAGSHAESISAPFAQNWCELFDILLYSQSGGL